MVYRESNIAVEQRNHFNLNCKESLLWVTNETCLVNSFYVIFTLRIVKNLDFKNSSSLHSYISSNHIFQKKERKRELVLCMYCIILYMDVGLRIMSLGLVFGGWGFSYDCFFVLYKVIPNEKNFDKKKKVFHFIWKILTYLLGPDHNTANRDFDKQDSGALTRSSSSHFPL